MEKTMHNQSIAEHHINNDGDAVTLTPVSSSGQYQTMPTIATTICGDELQSANSESVTSAPVVADVASTPAPVSSTTAFQSLDVENLGKFPSCLAQNCRFVCWRDEIRNGNPTKIPVDPHTGRDAESDNPMTWGTLTEAVTYYEGRTAKLRGVGRMFHPDDGIKIG